MEEPKKPAKKTSTIKFDDDTLKSFNIIQKTADPCKYEEICILLLQEIGRILKYLILNTDRQK